MAINEYPGPARVSRGKVPWHVERTGLGSGPWDTSPIRTRGDWEVRQTNGDPNLPIALAADYEARMNLGEVVAALRLVVGDSALADPPSNAESTAAHDMLLQLAPEQLTCFGVVVESVRRFVEGPRTDA